MSGTSAGAKKAHKTLLRERGKDYISKQRSKAGKASQAKNPHLANFRDPEFARKASKMRKK